MKQLKNIFSVLFTLALFTSCSSDDDGGDSNPVGGDHTYAIEVTSGFLEGTSFSGTVPNEEFIGLYVEVEQEDLLFLTQGLQGDSGFIIGGGVSIENGQPFPLTNTINGFEGSSLLVGFDIGNTTYSFESMSGTCSVTNLNKFPAANGTGIASYTLTFSGTFRQANTGGLDEEAPLVQMTGTVEIKRAI
jgi:hypothetical protein